MKYTACMALIALVVSACNKKDQLFIDPNNPLIGTWVLAQDESAATTYKRAARLQEDGYGLVFHADGKVVIRGIAGWCATPPVGYANYEGKWNVTDGTLNTAVRYDWLPEETSQVYKIVSVDATKLVVEYQ